jgi:hypothetical protein
MFAWALHENVVLAVRRHELGERQRLTLRPVVCPELDRAFANGVSDSITFTFGGALIGDAVADRGAITFPLSIGTLH